MGKQAPAITIPHSPGSNLCFLFLKHDSSPHFTCYQNIIIVSTIVTRIVCSKIKNDYALVLFIFYLENPFKIQRDFICIKIN